MNRLPAMAALLLCATTVSAAVHESPSVPKFVDVSVGFDGVFKVGHWIPVRIGLQASDRELHVQVHVTTLDSDGVECEFTDQASHRLRAGSTTTLTAYARPGRASPWFRIAIWEGTRRLAEKTVAAAALAGARGPTQTLLVGLGNGPSLEPTAALHQQPRDDAWSATHIVHPENCPHSALAFDGVDVLVLHTRDRQFLQQLDPDQWQAITDWVEFGGRLIISLSPESEELLAPGQPLSRLTEATFDGHLPQRDTTGLESFAGVESRLDVAAKQKNQTWQGVPTVRLKTQRGRVIVFDGNDSTRTDWVRELSIGLGSVTLLACDLGQEPISSWVGRPQLVARMVERITPPPGIPHEARPDQTIRSLGFRGLAGQLRMALDQFPSVRFIPFSWVAAAIAAYIVIISLGDYSFLRWVQRMTLTWITLPAWVLAATGLAWAAATTWKGNVPRTNQIEFVDICPTSRLARGTVWMRYFSPRATRLDLAVRPREAGFPTHRTTQTICTWQGFPGNGLGGMDSPATSALFANAYRQLRTPRGGVDNISLVGREQATWSSRGVTASFELRDMATDMSPLSSDGLGLLHGQVVNPLPDTLRDCGLLFDRWYYDLGDLEPGATRSVDSSLTAHDVVPQLTRRKVVGTEEVRTPWDPTGHDLTRIAEMLMFHETAGGTSFTGLVQRYLSRLDFSHRLQLDRAVLVGRSARPLAEFLRDGEPLQADPERLATFVRVLIPVLSRDVTEGSP